jgi:phage-related protein
MQSGPFYLGFWSSAGQSATIQFGTSNSGAAAQRANSVWYWVPNPTTATPATVDTGGFFGPVIKALLGIGIWIVTNVLTFLAFIAATVWPLFAAAWGFLANAVKTVLDTIGNFFGLGNLGTQLVSFFSSAGNFIVQYLSGVSAQIGNSLGFVVSAITQIIKFFNDAGGQIWSLLGDMLNVLGPVFQFFFTIYNVFTSLGLTNVQVMSLIMIAWLGNYY